MEKTRINLNPQKENTLSFVLRMLSAYTPFVVVGVIVVGLLLGVLQIFTTVRTHIYTRYTSEWDEWKGKEGEIKRMKAEISSLSAKADTLQQIATPENSVGVYLNEIFAALPLNIWFDSLTVRKEAIDLNGYVVKWEEDYLVSLDRFIEGLKSKELFSQKYNKISIKRSEKADYKGVEVLRFGLTCQR